MEELMINSVAHTDSICNDNLETKPKGKGGRPRKQPIAPIINGFSTCIAQTTYFKVPTVFVDIIAAIDNLAELKVVMYILRHTWGFSDFEASRRITIDEFMHGRKKTDGTRMDNGTGLSKSAVSDGLERAIKHGFVECFIDDRDRARVKHYYRPRMLNEGSIKSEPPRPEKSGLNQSTFPVRCFEEDDAYPGQLESQYPHTEETTQGAIQQEPNYLEQYPEDYDPHAGTIFSPNYRSPEQKIFASEAELKTTAEAVKNYTDGSLKTHRSKERTIEPTLRTKDIRNVHPSLNLEEAIRYLPQADQLPKPKAKSPAFIRNMISDFSQDLGDHDHVLSNTAQAANLYRSSGMSEEAFIQALYDAREAAKKATKIKHLNSHGNPNRMPYFFRCLSRASNPQETAI